MQITERRVDTRVNTTDRATSAPARRQTTLLAAPPGQTPTRIKPAAMAGGNEKIEASVRARSGIKVYWAQTPSSTRRGERATAAKDVEDIVKPIPSIMTARVGTMKEDRNQRKVGGWITAAIAPRNTQSGKRLVIVSNAFVTR